MGMIEGEWEDDCSLDVVISARYHRYAINFEKTKGIDFYDETLTRQESCASWLIGMTAGLTIGIILAGILASVFHASYTTVLLVWFGLTFVLAATGWIIGTILTGRYPAPEEEATATKSDVMQVKPNDLQSSQS